jgi:acyl carrier protein
MNHVAQELRQFIVTELAPGIGVTSIEGDDDLIRQGIVDSLGVAQLAEFIQGRFGISVEVDDVVPANFQTLTRLAAFVESRRSES